ncbi:MAG: DUF4465 domain-containing protein [Sedimentisphaerales bacterium]|nr:DUF4465 domain-containing protein [Sedimentisphaerales bacterium]
MLALVLAGVLGATANGTVATFEDLSLPAGSYWDGSDESGGFFSGDVSFSNNYDPEWGSWDGFAYSNLTDVNATGWESQYNAIAGHGQGGSATYGVAFAGWQGPPTITLASAQTIAGIYVTNNNYAYYDMLYGSPYSKQFGGVTGDDGDWFKLTITGLNDLGEITGAVDFYLADCRFADNDQDYIVDSWTFVDLTSLGKVDALQFSLDSSDSGMFGMNTPGYFCIDSLIAAPAPAEPNGAGRPYDSEPGIVGYLDALTRGAADPLDPNATLNPIFRDWATGVADYAPSDETWSGPWNDPNNALGPVTGDNFDIVSLGELNLDEINAGRLPGYITLTFGDPCDPNATGRICNTTGYDFAVFENAIFSQFSTPAGSVQGGLLAELGYVEVSSNGVDFARFPSVSLTTARVGAYGTIAPGDVRNLAGKHPNANGTCVGTPFDLDDLTDHPSVVARLVDVNDIAYVRIVDIPGSGDFFDDAPACLDPNTGPDWGLYADAHPIYDQWPTYGSGGFDLEAIGVLEPQAYEADINLDGVVDANDLDLMLSAFNSRFGQANWIARCDLAQPKDLLIDANDLAAFASQWGQAETWRTSQTTEQDE